MRIELYNAFYERDLGDVVSSGTEFLLRGVPSHRSRLIRLDTLIQCHIFSPVREYYQDATVRYHGPQYDEFRSAVSQDEDLYLYIDFLDKWTYLFSPICAHCARPHVNHPNGQCLFQTTRWDELKMEKRVTVND